MNKLKCEFCGMIVDHQHKAAVCVGCGHIMKIIPLTNNEFENIGDAVVIKKKKSVKKEKTDGTG